MKVLHDWDVPYIRSRETINYGVKLIIYGICRHSGIKINYVNDIYDYNKIQLKYLIKLDRLLGIHPIIGVLDKVENEFNGISKDLKSKGLDVRRHIHIGENWESKRIRTWVPIDGLEKITSNVWHYDSDYRNGKKPKLKDGEIPIFHIGRLFNVYNYIDFLYDVYINKMEL